MKAVVGAVVVGIAALLAGPAAAEASTSYAGPYATTLVSGRTICDTQKPFGFAAPQKRILVEGPGLKASFTIPAGAKVRWTVFVSSRQFNESAWREAGGWYRDGVLTSPYMPTWTFGVMNIPVRSEWSGEIRTREQVQVVDAYGRPYAGSTWGPYVEDEYVTTIYSYSPSVNAAFYGVCAF